MPGPAAATPVTSLHRVASLLACSAAVLLVTAVSARAATAPAAGRPPATVPLDNGWTFQPAGGPAQPVNVPHVFDPRPLASLFGGTTATYRLAFTGPATPAGFAWALRFEQVRRVAKVVLNGVTLGVNRDPYVPFQLPATSLKPGRRNDLVVYVDNRKGREPREGWWNWGGITRRVSLVPQGPVVLDTPGLLPDVRCTGPDRCAASVRFDGWVSNRSAAPATPRIDVRLRSPTGGPTTEKVVTEPALAPGATARVRFDIPVSHPALWSPEHPDRYAALIRTRAGTQPSQTDRMQIGLRSVAVRNSHLLLNGRRVQLRGASIQEDAAGRGPALTGADMDAIVSELRALRANVTRAHYLLNPLLLDRLDAAGILVWEQAPIYHRDVLLRTPNRRTAALRTLRGTILADRNHPSVITTSVANELSPLPDTLPGTRDYLVAAARASRDLDPAAPVSVDVLSYPDLPRQSTYAAFDMLGINNYYGWYAGKPERSTANIADLGLYLRSMRARYPRQAMVMTEFGAEATENGPATRKQTYAFQSDYIARTLDTVKGVGFMDGAIYWTLREFAVKPHWDGGAHPPSAQRTGIHHKGLLAYDGRPKPALASTEKLFAGTPLFRDEVARRPGFEIGGSALTAGVLLALLGLALFDMWCLAGLAAERHEAVAEILALRRELDGDDVAVGHDVVTALEA